MFIGYAGKKGRWGKGKSPANGKSSATATPIVRTHEEMNKLYEDNEVLAKTMGVTPDRLNEMKTVVNEYTGPGYEKFRAIDKSGGDATTKAINEFIEKAPKFDGVAYRGVKFPVGEALKVNNDFSFSAFSSTSTDMKVADEFADIAFNKKTKTRFAIDNSWEGGETPTFFKIRSKQGVSIQALSEFAEENEVLFSKKAKFKVASSTFNTRGSFWMVELVDAN